MRINKYILDTMAWRHPLIHYRPSYFQVSLFGNLSSIPGMPEIKIFLISLMAELLSRTWCSIM